MARVLIFWTQPAHLSVAETDAWIRGELENVTGITGVRRAELVRLQPGSDRFDSTHDWMLELHLAPGAAASDCLNARTCTEWLGDLRLLGMRPEVVVADRTQATEQR